MNVVAGEIGRLAAGLHVFVSPFAVTYEPARSLPEKRWMRGRCYHKRVQRKWQKRYGNRAVPSAFRVAGGIIAHPDVVRMFKEQFG